MIVSRKIVKRLIEASEMFIEDRNGSSVYLQECISSARDAIKPKKRKKVVRS
jgi:hypothetical protein